MINPSNIISNPADENPQKQNDQNLISFANIVTREKEQENQEQNSNQPKTEENNQENKEEVKEEKNENNENQPIEEKKPKSNELFDIATEYGRKKVQKVESPKKRQKYPDPVTFGVTDEVAFVLIPNKDILKVTELATGQSQLFKPKSNVCLIYDNNKPLFSTNEGFWIYNPQTQLFDLIPYELKSAVKIVIDPICAQRFFFLTKDKELYIIQKEEHKEEFENKLHKKNVDWFDVSRKYFLLSIEGMIQLWPRQDTAVECIWKTPVVENVKYFVDNNLLYELRDGIVTTRDAKRPDRVMTTTPGVWTLWKGTSVVIELEDSIQVNEIKIPVISDVVCADANRKYIVYYDANTFKAYIKERLYSSGQQEFVEDSDFIDAQKEVKKLTTELAHKVCMNIKDGSAKLTEGILQNKQAILDQMTKVLNDAKLTVSELTEIADYLNKTNSTTHKLINMFNDESNKDRLDEIVLMAIDKSMNEFMEFCIEAKISDNASKLHEETLLRLVPYLLQPLEEDPTHFAEILTNAILEIDTFDETKNNRQKLKGFGQDLLRSTVGLFQRLPENAPCQKYIRLLMNIAVSLKSA